MSIEAYKVFTSVVHNAPAANLRAEKSFASVVHDVPAANLRAEKSFASVVHDVPATDLRAEKVFVSVVHTQPGGKVTTEFIEHFDEPVQRGRIPTEFIEHFDEPVQRGRIPTEFIEHFDEPVQRGRVPALFVEAFLEFPTPTPPVALVPDISGTATVLDTFDGSGSTGDIDTYRWEWLSVPGGSAVANLPAEPFPDGGVTTWISMSGNQVLYHGEGTDADTSGNANNASLVNIGYAAGQVGAQGFDFLAANSTLQATTLIPTTTGVYSVSFWFYDLQPNVTWRTGLRSEDGFTDHPFIIETGTDRAGLYRASLGAFVYANFDMPAASYTGWHHVVVVSTGTVTQYFVDGAFRGYIAYTCTTGIRSFGNLNASFSGGQRFAQRMDEIAVWNRILSFAEVAAIYAVQSAAYAGTGVTFPFTPDVSGTYTVQLSVSNVESGVFSTDNADAVIGSAPSIYVYGVWPQEGNARMIDVQGQRLKRSRGQL